MAGRTLDVPLTVEIVVVGRREVGARDGTVRREDRPSASGCSETTVKYITPGDVWCINTILLLQ